VMHEDITEILFFLAFMFNTEKSPLKKFVTISLPSCGYRILIYTTWLIQETVSREIGKYLWNKCWQYHNVPNRNRKLHSLEGYSLKVYSLIQPEWNAFIF
jgi:hypothetical protein